MNIGMGRKTPECRTPVYPNPFANRYSDAERLATGKRAKHFGGCGNRYFLRKELLPPRRKEPFSLQLSVLFDIFVKALRGTITADPKGGGPNHERGGLCVIQTLKFGFQAGTADAVMRMNIGHLAQVSNAK